MHLKLICLFRRFAPNISECSDEFTKLALNFDNSFLPEYAGLCYLGAAKCEKSAHKSAEIDFLMKGARSFNKAHQKNVSLELQSNSYQNDEVTYFY